MIDYFYFFPDHGMIFLDNCAFDLDTKESRDIEMAKTGKTEILINLSKRTNLKLSRLTKKLSDIENWFIIKEVIEEFEDGISRLKELLRKVISSKLSVVTKEEITLKETLFELLKQKYESPIIDLNHRIARRKGTLLGRIEELFVEEGGKISERNTDCKLILAALVYAEREPAYIFSRDNVLLRTYASCSVELGSKLQGTYILNEEKRNIISSQQYWLDHC